MSAPPIAFRWTGEAMVPSHAAVADRHFVIGERYALVEHQSRSAASHNHEFAWLTEAWKSLPEHLADSFPTPEHLRRRALIDAGYRDELVVDAGSKAAALRVASAWRGIDDFAMVFVQDAFVIRWTAKSQSRRAMDAKTFQASKTAILQIVADLLGIAPEDLRRQREAA